MVRSVELILQLGSDTVGGARVRSLRSVGFVAGMEAGQPVVEEICRREGVGGWRLLSTPAALPERMLAKLRTVCSPDRLLDGWHDA